MDASSLNQAFECDVEENSALGAKNGLPPPTKFSIAKQKDMDPTTRDSLTALSNNAAIKIDSCTITSVSADLELLNYTDTIPAPQTTTQVERRKLRRKVNFAAGLQNEVERRRQKGNC
jgi:hypothetical protein